MRPVLGLAMVVACLANGMRRWDSMLIETVITVIKGIGFELDDKVINRAEQASQWGGRFGCDEGMS